MIKKIKKLYNSWFVPKTPKNFNNFFFTWFFIENSQILSNLKGSTQLKIFKKIDDEKESNAYKYIFHRRNNPLKTTNGLIKDIYFNTEFWFDL